MASFTPFVSSEVETRYPASTSLDFARDERIEKEKAHG
jgi:hypothetical protein